MKTQTLHISSSPGVFTGAPTLERPNYHFLLASDSDRHPLGLITPTESLKLQKSGEAAILRNADQYIVLVLTKRGQNRYQQNRYQQISRKKYTLSIDPGSRTTAFVIKADNEVVWALELSHRKEQIHESITDRAKMRRNRRQRKTRYRPCRYSNRKRPEGWLAPSILHIIETTLTWTRRIVNFCPISEILYEYAKFDIQKMLKPDIIGKEYQQGTLFERECRAYVMQRDDYTCQYCDGKNVPLEVDHVVCKSKGGTNRLSNLVVACRPCNQKKGTLAVEVFLVGRPEKLEHIKAQLQTNLKDVAAVNSTQKNLLKRLGDLVKPLNILITTWTGAQTYYNRSMINNIPQKQRGRDDNHWIDAACIGPMGTQSILLISKPIKVKSMGHGSRQMLSKLDKQGFPQGMNKKGHAPTRIDVKGNHIGHKQKIKRVDVNGHIIKTGDQIVITRPQNLKESGRFTGRAVLCNIDKVSIKGKCLPTSPNMSVVIQKLDGYDYYAIIKEYPVAACSKRDRPLDKTS